MDPDETDEYEDMVPNVEPKPFKLQRRYLMTNKEFAATNKDFRRACETLNVEPTAKRAGKFRKGTGIIWECLSAKKQKDLKHQFKKFGLDKNQDAGKFNQDLRSRDLG